MSNILSVYYTLSIFKCLCLYIYVTSRKPKKLSVEASLYGYMLTRMFIELPIATHLLRGQ